MRVPKKLTVQLRNTQGRALPLPDVLIGLNLLWRGRYYYGTLIGLTNEKGVAQILGQTIEEQFSRDQSNFPMDYKVALSDCDEEAEFVVLSPAEIETAKTAIEGNYYVDTDIQRMYCAAQNEKVRKTAVRTTIGLGQKEVLVQLPTEPVD